MAAGACAPAVAAAAGCPVFNDAPTAITGGVCGECSSSAQCMANQQCFDGNCVDNACDFTSDCPPGMYCDSNTCLPAPVSLRACSSVGLTCAADAGLANAPAGGAPALSCAGCIACSDSVPCAAGFVCTGQDPPAGYQKNACVRLALPAPASASLQTPPGLLPGSPARFIGTTHGSGCYTDPNSDNVTMCMCNLDSDCATLGLENAFCARDAPAIVFPTVSAPGITVMDTILDELVGPGPLMITRAMSGFPDSPASIFGGYCASGCGIGSNSCGEGSICDLATHTCVSATEPSATSCAAVGLGFMPETLTMPAKCAACLSDTGCPIGAGGCMMAYSAPANSLAWGTTPGPAVPSTGIGGAYPAACIAGGALITDGDAGVGNSCFGSDDCLPGFVCAGGSCQVGLASYTVESSGSYSGSSTCVTDFAAGATEADATACRALGGAVLTGSEAGVACGSANCTVCAAILEVPASLPGYIATDASGGIPTNGGSASHNNTNCTNINSANTIPRYIPLNSEPATPAPGTWWLSYARMVTSYMATMRYPEGIQLPCPSGAACLTGGVCHAGSTCVAGCCIPASCTSTSDCPSGTSCSPASSQCEPSCSSNSACASGFACVNGACIPAGCGPEGNYCAPLLSGETDLVCNWWGSPAAGEMPVCAQPCETASDCPGAHSVCGPYGVCGTACASDAGCPADSVCQAGQGGGVCVNAMGGSAIAFEVSYAGAGKSFVPPAGSPTTSLDAAPALTSALMAFGFVAGGPTGGTAALVSASPTVISGSSGYAAMFTALAPNASPSSTSVLAWPAPAGYAFAPASWAPPPGVAYPDTSPVDISTIAAAATPAAGLSGAGGWVAAAPGGASDAALVRGRPPLVPLAAAQSSDAVTATYFEPARPVLAGASAHVRPQGKTRRQPARTAGWAPSAPWWMSV